MKTIKVNEKTRIAIDGDNYIIQKLSKSKKEGVEDSWSSKSYFCNMEQCATELLDTLPGASSELTEELTSIKLAIKEAQTEILEAIKKI